MIFMVNEYRKTPEKSSRSPYALGKKGRVRGGIKKSIHNDKQPLRKGNFFLSNDRLISII